MLSEKPRSITKAGFPRTGSEIVHVQNLQNLTMCIYENSVPSFAEQKLERLYENFYSSFYSFTLAGDGNSGTVNTFVLKQGGKIKTLLLFTLGNGRVRVLNEMIRLSEEEITLFIEHVFARFPQTSSIEFRAIQMPSLRLDYPFQQFNLTEDVVLSLPGSVPDYQASLGKSTRKTVNENFNKLKRHFPSFEFKIYVKNEAKEDLIQSIVRFNFERRVSKAKEPDFGEEQARNIYNMVKACGVVFVTSVGGRICAGQICFQIGSNYFSLMNAHSTEFNQYRMGRLCNYLSICECIRRGGKEFHFLWGREEFKFDFLGKQRDFDELVVYRSPLHMALNGKLALRTAFSGRKRQARLWVLSPERKDHAVVKLAKKTLKSMRRSSAAKPKSS